MAKKTIDVSKIVRLTDKTIYGVPVHLEEMPLDVFLAHPEIDTQRDTEGRADQAFRTHLKHDSPLHALVYIAELPDGQRFVLDANTRRHLWENGKKNAVETVLAYTVEAATLEDARKLYYQLDSSTSVERNTDVAFGLLRAQKVQAKSELIRKSGYLTGMRKAFPIVKQRDAIGKASGLLAELDKLNLSRRALPAGAIGAFFLTSLRYGEEVKGFWEDVVAARGTANDEGRTPAMALAWRIDQARQNNKLTGDRNVGHLMEVALGLVEAYQKDPDALIADKGTVSVKRDTFIKQTISANAEHTDWFVKVKPVKPAKPKKEPKVKAAKATPEKSKLKTGKKPGAKPIATKTTSKKRVTRTAPIEGA